MKLLRSGLIIISFVFAAFAQSPEKLIFWGGDTNCGFKSRGITSPETAKCDSISTERGPVSVITYDGVTLAAAFLEEDGQLIVGTRIANSTDEVIGFDSDDWGAAHFDSKADFYSGKKPILAETSVPTRDIIRGMSREGKLGNLLGEFVAENQMTAETKRIRRADGTEYLRTTIVPDKEAREAEARQRVNRTESLTIEQRRIRATALTRKSVAANSFVKGLVYFRLENKAELVVFSLKVADTTFVFLLPRKAS